MRVLEISSKLPSEGEKKKKKIKHLVVKPRKILKIYLFMDLTRMPVAKKNFITPCGFHCVKNTKKNSKEIKRHTLSLKKGKEKEILPLKFRLLGCWIVFFFFFFFVVVERRIKNIWIGFFLMRLVSGFILWYCAGDKIVIY